MNVEILGKLITSPQERDAIHIAVAPVTASARLLPGQHVGLSPGSADHVEPSDSPVGVIDPFLTAPVSYGQRCWLFLYPGTITALRHEWAHPAFQPAEVVDAVAQSRRWLEGLAAQCDQTYNRLMAAAALWVDDEEYTYDNSEQYKEVDFTDFWEHYEVVTGTTVPAQRKEFGGHFFTCSC